MKKQIVLSAIAALFSLAVANAQGGGGNFQRKTPEERLIPYHQKIDSAFKLDAAKLKQVDDIFLKSFKDSDNMMADMREAGTPDREQIMAARKKLKEDRDAKLKEVLSEEQMKILNEQIEPSLRPTGGRGRGGN